MGIDITLDIEVDTGGPEPYVVNLFWANYTHNVTPMWGKAGVYEALYDSEGKLAGELLSVLDAGLFSMSTRPEEYLALNPENGWGDYEGAIKFLDNFYKACLAYPKAKVHVSA